jgi:hypothetical protein
MNKHKHRLTWATLVLASTVSAASPAAAQVAGGSTTVGISVIESTQIATGWSVKKTLLGKTIYNETGQKIGKVADLIISPDKKVSYVIVGAGGFIGIGRHDVAIPVTQIQDQTGRLVMPGATKDTIKSLPTFTYADDTARRDRFVAAADRDIAEGKARVSELEKKAGTAATDAVLEEFRREGVDDTALAERLQREGVEAFATSWHAMLSRIREKCPTQTVPRST